MFNKKSGQIGETITWVVATIIIIVILLISIFAATSYPGKSKGAFSSEKRNDFIASESFFAYLLTEDERGQTVHEQLKNEENLNDFNGNLAIKIFEGFYREEYAGVWVGIIPHTGPLNFIKNKYFGSDTANLLGEFGWEYTIKKPHVPQIISLDESKSIELVLAHE